jgi:hypothetical protein
VVALNCPVRLNMLNSPEESCHTVHESLSVAAGDRDRVVPHDPSSLIGRAERSPPPTSVRFAAQALKGSGRGVSSTIPCPTECLLDRVPSDRQFLKESETA